MNDETNFPYKAVLFDWAYTLVDLVNEDDRAAFQKLFEFLRRLEIPLPELDEVFSEYQKLFYGLIEKSRETHQEACFETVLKALLIQFNIELQGRTNLEELLSIYYQQIFSCRKVYADTVPTLEDLKSRGVRLGIISNTTNPGFIKHQERKISGLDSYFEFSIYSSEVPFRKPHASIFQLALRRLGMSSRDVLYVGDNIKADVLGAHAVGMPAAWLNRRREQRPPNIQPEYEIHSLLDVTKIGCHKMV